MMEIGTLLIGIAIGAVIGITVYALLQRGKTVSKVEFEREQEARREQEIRCIAETERLDLTRSEKARLEAERDAMAERLQVQSKESARLEAQAESLSQTLENRKNEIETLRKQFNLEFENIATKVLEDKTERFAKVNRDSLNSLLEPLKENIRGFRERVEQVYDKESKERFSLGNEVKRLAELNQKISEEANNLTTALKGNSKTQGDWGEMILESILEKSGLTKGREYFVQETLCDENGVPLKNEHGQRMQPDVMIRVPDERNIVIDSKVSLTAYVKYVGSTEEKSREEALSAHITSVRKHIDELSKKSYHEYAGSMDFVLMFVPNEPAYLLAMQTEPDLWHQAYEKRVVLISPTNLIATIKLIVDIWKKDYQNQNALEIADRGAKLYDKFAAFVDNLGDIGTSLDKAQASYTNAFKQLSTGTGNLMWQAEQLEKLGVKGKKKLKTDNNE